MNSYKNGEHKLLFILPVFPETGNILFLDFESGGLSRKLSTLGIEVRAGSLAGRSAIPKSCEPALKSDPDYTGAGREDGGIPAVAGGYDLIVAGRLPAGRREEDDFIEAVGNVLSVSGYLVAVVSNKHGYARLLGKVKGRDPAATGEFSPAFAGKGFSLRGVLRILGKMGFGEINTFSPVPSLKNPSVFISLEESNSLEFLMAQFPDFLSTRSRLFKGLLKLTIKTNMYKYILNQYVIVAGKRRHG